MDRKAQPTTTGGAQAPPSAAPDALVAARRELVAALQEDLLPVAESLDGYCQMLVDAVEDYPEEYRKTVGTMRDGAGELYKFVRKRIDPDGSDLGSQQFDEHLRGLRHELGNRLNQVLGYCQLLLLDEEEHHFGALAGDLQKIKELCNSGEAALVRHKQAATPQPQLREAGANGEPARQAPEVAGTAAIGTPDRPRVEPATVLVVDDSPASRDVLARILEREGHTVDVAANGREALEMLAQREYDLVLLDFIMPEMNGYQTLQKLKADERLRHTPVIIVSALDTMHEVVACIEIGAEDFLTKPVDLQLLRARTSACLEKKRLREREFGQFFTPELARQFVRHPELLREGREANVSILFCDIRRFSRYSEMLGPSDTVRWLSDVMAVLSDCVINHRGVLVDYIGDELMAMWGAPEELENHADLACEAALEMLAQMPALSKKWKPILGQETSVGIGINTGIARVGNTGSQRKFKYGPLGSPVNLASRVQGATKYLGTDLIITENTLVQLHKDFVARRLCRVRVVNIERPVELHEILATDSSRERDLKERYEYALTEFEGQNFRVAASVLGQLLVDYPDDGPALMLMSRVIEMLLHPGAEFDPVWELSGK